MLNLVGMVVMVDKMDIVDKGNMVDKVNKGDSIDLVNLRKTFGYLKLVAGI